ncbi:MAG: aminopeptidase P family protein [Chloroflexi bacterium]|nr:aminopeptidase P family protein [Chloroflexota bacterium]
MSFKERLQRLRQALPEREVGGILISQPENRRYLSGFDGSAGILFITPDRAVMATDFRYVEQVKLQSPDYEIFRTAGDMVHWFGELLGGFSGRLGFEAGHVTVAGLRQMGEAVKGQNAVGLMPVEGLVEKLRAVKEPGEIEHIAGAARIALSAQEYARDIIRPGMTEKELAWQIEKFLRENGSQGMPFDIIVASGPNSALPHARPSERRIGAGEPVVIDLGARVEGYCSDLTRTLCPGSPDDTFNRIYDIVLGAQLTALAIISEGMTGEQADASARAVITEAGYGEAFGHALGHGVGLAAHEMPRLGAGSGDRLEGGMVFTIEPGIYLPGWGGVRIEDMAIIEGGRAVSLSKSAAGSEVRYR